MKFIKLKVNSEIINILVMTIVIILLLCILPIVFLNRDKKISIFDIGSSEIVKSSSIDFPADGKVKLYLKEENKTVELNLEDYITGVVASEVPADFNKEALKAQAVAARTFYMNKRKNPCKDAETNGGEICDTTNCQVYMSKEKRMSSWSRSKGEENWNKIKDAVDSTKSQVLTYDGELLEYPQFFSTSSGKTEDAKDVFAMDIPYLKSQDSEGEESAPKYQSSTSISADNFIKKINSAYPDSGLKKDKLSSVVSIKSYTEGGSVKEIQLGGSVVKGTDFRKLFNLNSSNFTISINGNTVVIKCKGYGHGVGMSQWGANAMAKNGSTYDEILKHYYSGVDIEKIKYTE